MQDTCSTRRGKLATLAAPTISSLNRSLATLAAPTISSLNRSRVRSPATTASSSPSTIAKRTANRLGSNLHQGKQTNGHTPTETLSTPKLSKPMISRANSTDSDHRSISVEHTMALPSDEAPKSQSSKPNHPPSNPRKATREKAKSSEDGRGRPITASAQSKKAITEANNEVACKKTLQDSGGVEKSVAKGPQNQRPINRVRREKVAIRGKRRGYHVADLPSRRKLLTHRSHCGRRDIHVKKNPANTFCLTSLEEYLKDRAMGPRQVQDMDSPNSHLAHLQKPNLMMGDKKLFFVGEPPSQLVGISLNDPRLLAKFAVRTIVSTDEADDIAGQEADQQRCAGMSLHWLGDRKNDGLLHYAGSCFSASKRRMGSRRKQLAYMYNSERSFSSLYSDTETAPLMTEPEPFHEYGDTLTASSGEVDDHQPPVIQAIAYRGWNDGHVSDAYSITSDACAEKQKETISKHRSISQKYRPKAFKDLIGQNMVIESLSNAILRSKIAPVYLFHGPRGTGKTTAAKIFTCAMNCLSIEELRPCGLCKACTSFHAGKNYDMKEVDAAAHNELQSMRFMLKHLALPPAVSRYKVFIMDDCHMLTMDAWNALLKSLEEPPDYVVFILITTDVEQVPRAAMSQCQKFMFSRIKDADVVFRLRKLAQQEGVDIDLEALQFVAAQSDGSLRDAETMLDQLSLLAKRVTLAAVREMVGLIPEDQLINLLELALSPDTIRTVNTVRQLMHSGVEPLALVAQLATLITDILAGRHLNGKYSDMRVSKDQKDRLQQALTVLLDAEKQLRSCSDRTTWLTAAFLQFASGKNAGSKPSSPRGTSETQSPTVFADTNERDMDCTCRRHSWGGREKWDTCNAYCQELSGPFVDNEVYLCDNSPQSGPNMDDKVGWVLRSIHKKGSDSMSPCTMDSIWQKVLQGNCSNVLKQFLQVQGRLVSLSVTEAFAIVHLEFRSVEHKTTAERAKHNISTAFQMALSCPVKVEISSLSSLSQGQSDFTCRGGEQSIQPLSKHRLLEPKQGNTRGSSFKKSSSSSSFRNMDATTPSTPRCRDLELRRPAYGLDADGPASFGRRSADTSFRDLQVYKRSGEPALHQDVNGDYMTEHPRGKEPRSSCEDARFSTSLHWSDTREDLEYSSDSEIDGRHAPGLLCWKGARMRDDKAKQHTLRRRRTRFLLRLVPCTKEEEEEEESPN